MARLECQRCRSTFDGRRDAKYCGASCRAAAAKERAQSRSNAQRGRAGRRSSALTRALTRTTRSMTTTETDQAALGLARLYARALDADPDALRQLGPQYLQVLTALGMTRRDAKRIVAAAVELDTSGLDAAAGRPAGGESKLVQLRRARAERTSAS